jgi:hypothetical protein
LAFLAAPTSPLQFLPQPDHLQQNPPRSTRPALTASFDLAATLGIVKEILLP